MILLRWAARPALLLAMIAGMLAAGCRERSGQVQLVFSADTRGFLEDCDCGSAPMGGLARRADLLRRLRSATGTPMLLVDGGNLHHVLAEQSHHRAADELVRAMGKMGYDVVVLGARDASLQPEDLASLLNAAPFRWLGGAYRNARGELGLDTAYVREVGGLVVGVLDHVDPAYASNKVESGDVDNGLLRRAALLRPVCNVLVVVAAVDPRGSEALARDLDGLADLLLVTGASEGTAQVQEVGGVMIASVSDRGRHLGRLVVDVHRGQLVSRSWSLLPVDGSLDEDPAVVEQIRQFRQREEGLERGRRERLRLVRLREMGISTVDLPGQSSAAWYAGAESCRHCHAAIWDSWRTSAHAGAFAALSDSGRADDASGQRRTVTGWMEKGGWLSRLESPHLAGVQCEFCHGRGSMHAATRGELFDEMDQQPAQACVRCHRETHPLVDPHTLQPAN